MKDQYDAKILYDVQKAFLKYHFQLCVNLRRKAIIENMLLIPLIVIEYASWNFAYANISCSK